MPDSAPSPAAAPRSSVPASAKIPARKNCPARAGWRSPKPLTGSASAPTPPCFTATSRPWRKGWSTSTCCAGPGRDRRLHDLYPACLSSRRTPNWQNGESDQDLRHRRSEKYRGRQLYLDNFDHIKAYWVMIGPKLAQVALPLAPTISTAPSRRRSSPIWPAPIPIRRSAQDPDPSDQGSRPGAVERDTLYKVMTIDK